MLTLVIILLGVIAGLSWVLIKQYRELKSERSNIADILDSYHKSNLAWEEGQLDLQELYEMQILSFQEKNADLWETTQLMQLRIDGYQREIAELRGVAEKHDSDCLLPLGEYPIEE